MDDKTNIGEGKSSLVVYVRQDMGQTLFWQVRYPHDKSPSRTGREGLLRERRGIYR